MTSRVGVIADLLRRSRALGFNVCLGMSTVLVPHNISVLQLPVVPAMPLAVGEQGSLILKIVSSDSELRSRREDLRLGIVYLPGVAVSTSVKDELAASMPSAKAGGRTLTAIPLLMTSADDLERAIERNSIDVLYVTPGLDSVLGDVLSVSRRNGVLTVTGVPEYVDRGVTVGFVGGSRMQVAVTVNLRSARDESRRFDTSFLDKVRTR
jgi:YfiR/HmsC-like